MLYIFEMVMFQILSRVFQSKIADSSVPARCMSVIFADVSPLAVNISVPLEDGSDSVVDDVSLPILGISVISLKFLFLR